MKIVMTSDFHGTLPVAESISDCDLILVAGDVGPVWNHSKTYHRAWFKTYFNKWIADVGAPVVWIGGNHDFLLQTLTIDEVQELVPNGIYLDNSEAVIGGMKIWGSPYSPKVGNWAFMKEDKDLVEVWDLIPADVDILMVHGPMYRHLDYAVLFCPGHVGSRTLFNRLAYGGYDNLKFLVSGHIHEGYGTMNFEWDETKTAFNASIMNEKYEYVNDPIIVEV